MSTPPERTSHRIRAARVGRRPAGIRAGIFALALVFAFAFILVLHSPPRPPTPTVQGIQGTYVWQSQARGATGVDRSTGSFSAVASGNAGGQMTTQNTAPRAAIYGAAKSAYDAAAHAETTLGGNDGRLPPASRTIGAWPPVWRVATHGPLDYQGLAAIVRSAVEDRDRSIGIKPLKDGERKVWRAALTLGGRDIAVVVDQLTGIVTWYADSTSTFTAKVAWGSPPQTTAAYTIDLPSGTRVATERDSAYRYRTTLAAAAASVGYAPLESTLEPDGYTLRAVAVRRPYQAPLEWLTGSAPFPPGLPRPRRANEIALLYTRGLTWFSVQMVAARGTPRFAALSRRAVDLYAVRGLSPRSEVLQYGAFAGATAHTWYAEDGPTLFVANDDYAVVSRGGLTRQELLSLAEGLKPLGSGPSASPSPSP